MGLVVGMILVCFVLSSKVVVSVRAALGGFLSMLYSSSSVEKMPTLLPLKLRGIVGVNSCCSAVSKCVDNVGSSAVVK
jgi:hypothetical protein